MLASFAKAYVTCLLLGVTFLFLASDSETNNSVWKAMLASFAKAYVTYLLLTALLLCPFSYHKAKKFSAINDFM